MEIRKVSIVLRPEKASSIHYMETQERIIQEAQKQFLRYGVRSITMDDIARNLGISKKTIYQYYQNKAELVTEMGRLHFAQEIAQSEHIEATSSNALEGMVRIALWSMEMFRNMAPHLVHEIRKYYPAAWALFDDFKTEFVLKKVIENLHQGMQEGLYRPDIDVEIVAMMRISQIDMSIREDYFPPETYDPAMVQMQMFELYLYGIVTKKGRDLLDNYLAETPLVDIGKTQTQK